MPKRGICTAPSVVSSYECDLLISQGIERTEASGCVRGFTASTSSTAAMLDYLRNLLQGDATATPTTPIHDAAVEHNVDFQLGDFAIDDYKPMKIIAIGAGMSGILASIRFRQYIHNLTLTIYEKEDRIGGTWHVNRYPGVACDVPSHSYQYSFENKSDWSAVYSPGSEILEHMEQIVAKYKLEPYIKLRHELTHARYDEATAKWHVHLKRSSSTAEGQFEEFEDEADFLFMGVGILSRWDWPDIKGLHEFKGTLVHSADWNLGGATWEDDVKDWGEKSVAVIGLGSSALQIASALQDKVGRLTQYARGRTWVVPPFFQDKVSAGIGNKAVEGDENYKFTNEEIKALEDPAKFTDLRRAVDTELCSAHLLGIRDSEAQMEAQERNRVHMTTALASVPEIAEKLIPDFSVSCRRLTPAPGYLKGLAERKIHLVGTDIKRVTQDAVETTDGVATKHDVVICATGASNRLCIFNNYCPLRPRSHTLHCARLRRILPLSLCAHRTGRREPHGQMDAAS
ncbi:hypothetical protein NM688_g7640 [Phlebia brevispora]|uniref:Uncharacterized protein n=1 Tax=Phlebia brevispora TaxID=194682 RepID=A0ACC1S2T7_9APHY|nr:hypothetical protein NM688_g7640 [Phlebia brevispora]